MSTDARGRAGALLASGVTDPPTPRARWQRWRGVDLVAVADVALALIGWGATNSTLSNLNAHNHGGRASAVLVLVSLLVAAPVAVRTWFPLGAWCAALAGMYWATTNMPGAALPYPPFAVFLYALCLYAVAVRCRQWVVTAAAAITIIGGLYVNITSSTGAIVVALVPVSAGVIVRSRRRNREQLAVVERRHEGERTVLEERQRIARELHDVVAHHMSVIAIQAEAAPYKTPDPPQELVDSFAEIRASALTGLNELRRVLGVLRSDRADTVPQPGLDDLPALLDSARAGGVTVTSSVSGTPRTLPDGVDLSAYRILQEALSNAMRHAPGSAVAVKLRYGDGALGIEVRNGGPPTGPGAAGEQRRGTLDHGSGTGIIGMRERATMLGGVLSAGPTGKGEFLVTAALPLEQDGPADPQ
jgi:signal transduction histidine kinase